MALLLTLPPLLVLLMLVLVLVLVLPAAAAAETDVIDLTAEAEDEQLGTGLTLDACTTDASCSPPRYCVRDSGDVLMACEQEASPVPVPLLPLPRQRPQLGVSLAGVSEGRAEEDEEGSGKGKACFCAAMLNLECETSAACDFGERCAPLYTGAPICVSCAMADALGLRGVDDGRSCDRAEDGVILLDAAGEEEEGGGEEGDGIGFSPLALPSSQSTAVPSRSPAPTGGLHGGDALPPPAPPDDEPSLPSLPPTSVDATPNAAADDGDGGGDNEGDNNSDNDGAVCVDAALLAHLPRSALVFRTHRRARVLCDPYGSCATPGHLVVFRHSAMTMASYCSSFPSSPSSSSLFSPPHLPLGAIHQLPLPHRPYCAVRFARVNSPRVPKIGGAWGFGQIRVRIPTRTPHLRFTAHAARHATRFEEALLTFLYHLHLL